MQDIFSSTNQLRNFFSKKKTTLMKSFLIIPVVLLLVLVSSIFAGDLVYDYDGGPESWNVKYRNCKGNKQSPINFDTSTDRPITRQNKYFYKLKIKIILLKSQNYYRKVLLFLIS